ncbi:MAG: AtpZ/AtpI family protein [Bacteroidales bacterium]|nr:AtpZ/AtpI family protein [Bacteroidales bacterium]
MKKAEKNPVSDLKKYTKYSGLAMQMGVIMTLGTYGGVKADAYFATKPLFILIGSLGSFSLALYWIIKEISHLNPKP